MAFLAPLLALALVTAGGDSLPATSPLPELQDAAPVTPKWTGALTLGATWTNGNSETTTINGSFNAERRAEKDRWTYDAFVNYGENTDIPTNDTTETTNNYGASVKYDYFASEKLYYLAKASGKVDHVATLDLQTVVGAGVGYQWKETEKLEWGTEVGLSYVDENFEEPTPPAESTDADYVAVRLASNLKYEISKTSSFEQVAEILPSLEDSEDVLAKVDNRLKMVITGNWIAQIQYVLDYDDSPASGKEEADHRVVVSIGWNFGS